LWTARWISAPIIRLSKASSQIASGNLEETVEIEQIQELRTLANSFNRMAGQLQTSFSELEANNVALEERVADRTAELQAAKDTADHANRAKSDFLSQMSHELRTPLNGILGYAQILQRDPALLLKHQVGLRVIYQSGQHLLTLINDLLDLAKIEAGKLELCPSEFHLEQFLQNLQEICQVRAEAKDIHFRIQAATPLPIAIYADEKRLRQVLLNLIGNSIKFTHTGEVSLKVSHLGSEHFRLEVIDTGVGMTPAELERIFLPFEQGGNQQQRSEGTGLGLAITQQILTQMQSRLQVESASGQGSRFWFEVDLATVQNWQPTPAVSNETSICGYEGEQRRILVVDDRWENRTILVNMLEPLGFEVIEALHGGEGLTKAQTCQPDLIITDLVMPELDGFQMTQKIRQIESLQRLPIIASSASVYNFSRQQSQAAGCDYFLSKPLQMPEVLNVLQSSLHLVWRYRNQPEIADANSAIPSELNSVRFVVPPANELEHLTKLAAAGYVTEVMAELERIRQLHPSYQSFVDHLQGMVDEFDLAAIPSLLATYHQVEAVAP
jgi:signal transduction histidine kinase/CheY-like chemotaxis protein